MKIEITTLGWLSIITLFALVLIVFWQIKPDLKTYDTKEENHTSNNNEIKTTSIEVEDITNEENYKEWLQDKD